MSASAKKFERELQETQKLESLGLLAGGIAHDFNNLLTGILGNASLAFTEVPADDPVRMRLRQIVQAGERAAFLTRQMLAYAGRGRFVTEAIDLGDLVREISTLVRTSIPKTVELKLDLAPDLPPIEADPAQMQQVIMNLVINGAEAIGENATGKVEIRTCACEIDAREAANLFASGASRARAIRATRGQRHRHRHGRGDQGAHLRSVLHDEVHGPRIGPGGRAGNHQGTRRRDPRLQHAGAWHNFCDSASRQAAEKPSPPGRKNRKALAIPSGSVALVIDDEEAIRMLAEHVLFAGGNEGLDGRKRQGGCGNVPGAPCRDFGGGIGPPDAGHGR